MKKYFPAFWFYLTFSVIIIIASNYAALALSAFVYAGLFISDYSSYHLPEDSTFYIYQAGQLVLSLIAFFILNLIAIKKFKLTDKLFLLLIGAISAGYYGFLLLVCTIDIFFGCKYSDVLSFESIAGFGYYKLLPMLSSYLVVTRLSKQKIFVKILSVKILFVLFALSPIIKFYSSTSLLGNIEDDELPILLKRDPSVVAMHKYTVADSGYVLSIPLVYSEYNKFYKDENFSFLNDYTNPDEYQFDYNYRAAFVEGKYDSSIFISLYRFKQSQDDKAVFDFINYCGADLLVSPYTRDFSEFCSASDDIVLLANGIEYCETLNRNSQLIIEKSVTPLSSKGAHIIENRERVFIAKLPDDPDHCLQIKIIAEPKDADEKNIRFVVERMFESVSKFD